MSLNNKQKKFLRQAAHHLKPIILTGQHGISENLIAEIEQALTHHELIKIKIRSSDKEERNEHITSICEKTKAERIQVLGNVLTIFKKNEEMPVIVLPK